MTLTPVLEMGSPGSAPGHEVTEASPRAAASTASAPLLSVRDLTIGFPTPGGGVRHVTESIGFTLAAGASLALVGESGSGKTMVGKALLGLLPDDARIVGGSVRFQGRELLTNTPAQWWETRGTGIGMVFQEPMVSLNPAMRVGDQLTEALVLRRGLARAAANAAAIQMLARVRVRDPKGCMMRYPHEFSGGMRQRILLAAVMLLKPALLIADEPTTALDCIVQKEVLDVLMALTREDGTALLFISHNLALVAAYTDAVLVMRQGEMMEQGPVRTVLARPASDYTMSLLEALPKRPDSVATPHQETLSMGEPRTVAKIRPAIELHAVAIDYPKRGEWFKKDTVRAVHPSSFDVAPGETVAIVGESGSGKTSLAKSILGLVRPSEGRILIDGKTLLPDHARSLREARRAVRMIFQDPYSSLDSRMDIASLVEEALRDEPGLDARECRERVKQVLADVGLSDLAKRGVHQLSGGQRQRVAIARALVSRPAVVLADEPVSALDVTVQSQILAMLVDLQRRYGFAMLLISHDLGVVEQIADRVLVMYHGHLVEEGSRDAVFDNPAHPYTRRLLQAVPEVRGNRHDGFHVETRQLVEAFPLPYPYFDPLSAPPGSRAVMIDISAAGATEALGARGEPVAKRDLGHRVAGMAP